MIHPAPADVVTLLPMFDEFMHRIMPGDDWITT